MKRSWWSLSFFITSTFLVMAVLSQLHGSHSYSLPYPLQPFRVITDDELGWAAIPFFLRHSARGFLSAGHMAASRQRRSASHHRDFVHIPNQIRLGAPLIPYRNDFPISFPGSHLISDMLSMVNYFNFEKLPEIRIFG